MIGLLRTSVTIELGLLAPVASGEARGELVLQSGGNSDSVPTLGHTHTLPGHLGRGAARPFPESNRVAWKLALQLHPHIILIFLLLTLTKQTNNSAWISKLTPARVKYIYIFFPSKQKKKISTDSTGRSSIQSYKNLPTKHQLWLWVLTLGLPIIGDLVVSGQTMGRHLLLVCMSQRPSEMLFPNKRGLTQRQVFCLKLWKISQAFLHSNKISRPCSGHSCSTLCKKKNSS